MAIVCSVSLVTEPKACSLLSRDQHSRDNGGASDDVTRLEYSMAIVRMVNGISDKAQKGKTALSVSSNAAAAGMFVATSPQGSMMIFIILITMHSLLLTAALDPACECTSHLNIHIGKPDMFRCKQDAVTVTSTAQPSRILWDAAGLPRLLVDVRHEASHNDMPSLSLLRLAAAQALDWLQAAYWQRQEAFLQQHKGRVVQLLQVQVPRMHIRLHWRTTDVFQHP